MFLPEWLRSFLDSFVPYAPLAQVLAYTTLTLTSIIVAVVSLRFSYRQNFGWKPILLVSTHGMTGKPKKGSKGESFTTSAVLKFEVWNRHTYPIVLEQVNVNFKQNILDYQQNYTTEENPWYVQPYSKCHYRDRVVVKNGEHHEFVLEAVMVEDQSLDAIDGMVDISVAYYDPRRVRRNKLFQAHRFHFKNVARQKKSVYKWIRQVMGVEYNGPTSR